MALVTTLISCNQGPTLQTYYVDNELKSGYAQIDAPTSLINIEHVEMTEQQRNAYKSVDKLNILTYMPKDSSTGTIKQEIEKVTAILKNPKYEELVRGSTGEGKYLVKYIGDIDNVDEVIIFGSDVNRGFIIARLLGDDMNAGKIYALRTVLDKAKFDDTDLKGLSDFFK